MIIQSFPRFEKSHTFTNLSTMNIIFLAAYVGCGTDVAEIFFITEFRMNFFKETMKQVELGNSS